MPTLGKLLIIILIMQPTIMLAQRVKKECLEKREIRSSLLILDLKEGKL